MVVTTVAGSSVSGWKDGQGSAAKFAWPTGLACSARQIVYIADLGNHMIRQMNSYVFFIFSYFLKKDLFMLLLLLDRLLLVLGTV